MLPAGIILSPSLVSALTKIHCGADDTAGCIQWTFTASNPPQQQHASHRKCRQVYEHVHWDVNRPLNVYLKTKKPGTRTTSRRHTRGACERTCQRSPPHTHKHKQTNVDGTHRQSQCMYARNTSILAFEPCALSLSHTHTQTQKHRHTHTHTFRQRRD